MAMVATQAVLSSSLASKILATGSLAKAGGAAVGSVLAGLPSAGLTLPFKAALTGAASSLGSLLGTLSTSSLIGSPPVTLMASSLGALAVGAVPVVLGAMGYTGAGITASSLAAKMMSAAAIANGGGVAAGSLVATLQSVGAGGLSLSSKALLGTAGSVLLTKIVGL
ncbi:interferon alpha-inducible protein 27, mitochondrial-like isoform X3 [Phacochoerus africanus]|uniref:interferon alpha-inducible protein 27, mitochondrial-like isoform X3 n=1 Tax=Phacochoerus africanus TaxID=41426 RepID=UPI001FDA8C91|nr:interferon alpha-inducible protein 27, mitochondrial-like isoform X3 [Phacochoerus africanus]